MKNTLLSLAIIAVTLVSACSKSEDYTKSNIHIEINLAEGESIKSKISNPEIVKSLTITGVALTLDNCAYICENMTQIQNLNISRTKTKIIVAESFLNCTSLISVAFPTGLYEIGRSAFEKCTSLGAITITDSITTIGANAFSSCTSLIHITIPEDVTTINEFAFSNCSSLESINIKSEITTLANGTFANCTSLKSALLPDDLKEIGTFAFDKCTSLTDITIPYRLLTINASAFNNCSSIVNIILPKSLTTIEALAFNGCSQIKTITSLAIEPPTLNETCFNGTDLANIYVPKNSVTAYKEAAVWTNYADIIEY